MGTYQKILFLVIFFLNILLPGQVFAGKIIGTVKVKGLRSPANVLVYLSKAPPAVVDVSGAKFVVDQRNLAFIPHVLPVLVGTTVHFPNNDKVSHNAVSYTHLTLPTTPYV